jgi:hypothetical protein
MAKIDTAAAPTEVPEDLLVKAANMNIKQFVPHEKPGLYDDQVNTLIEVDDATGFQNSIEVLVPAADVLKHKRYFNASAAKRDKTARIVNGEKGQPQGDGGVLLEFVLTPKVHRKTKPADTADTPTAV